MLEEAIKKAYEEATSNDIVLLSPASNSFDMKTLTNTSNLEENPYDNFKNAYDRGDKFKEMVNRL